MPNLDRFKKAQQGLISGLPPFDQAYQEISAGEKTSHWIWYVLPQLIGMGSSQNSQYYGIENFAEACAFLQDDFLFENYKKMVELITKKSETISFAQLLGGDEVKFVSSLTLFSLAADHLGKQIASEKFKSAAKEWGQLFTRLHMQGLNICENTLMALRFEKMSEHLQGKELSSPKQNNKKSSFSFIQSTSLKKPTPTINTKLLNELNKYISERKNEWQFHYNFLGFVGVIYYLMDYLTGTNHFNSKMKDIKISAATKLKEAIENPKSVSFSGHEMEALNEGRLGKIIQNNGGKSILNDIIPLDQKSSINPNIAVK